LPWRLDSAGLGSVVTSVVAWQTGGVARVRSAAAGKPADCDVGYAQRVSSNHFGSHSSAS
jgi:hypothetical protein